MSQGSARCMLKDCIGSGMSLAIGVIWVQSHRFDPFPIPRCVELDAVTEKDAEFPPWLRVRCIKTRLSFLHQTVDSSSIGQYDNLFIHALFDVSSYSPASHL